MYKSKEQTSEVYECNGSFWKGVRCKTQTWETEDNPQMEQITMQAKGISIRSIFSFQQSQQRDLSKGVRWDKEFCCSTNNTGLRDTGERSAEEKIRVKTKAKLKI